MTRAFSPLTLILSGATVAQLWQAAPVTAQASLLEVDKGEVKLMQVNDDGGLVALGREGQGVIPARGAGPRLMWYPGKAAFRAGVAVSTTWDDENVGRASVASGAHTTASGEGSTALGIVTVASGRAATAMGDVAKATGSAATAMGENTTASSRATTATGLSTTASGEISTAMGQDTKATGTRSTAMGLTTTASGDASTAMGSGTTASGSIATAMGVNSIASGNNSTAMGAGTRSSGNESTAMGSLTSAGGEYSTAMGRETKAIGSRSTAMGFKTTATDELTTVMGANAGTFGGRGSFVYGDASTSAAVVSGTPNEFLVRAAGGFRFRTSPTLNTGCDLPPGSGSFNCTSSRLAKEGFEDLDGEMVLDELATMPIQRWRYRGTAAFHVGPTAEDFHAAFGLGQGPTTISTVDADGISLRAIQALERRTAELRAENDELRAKLEALRALVTAR